MIDAAFWQGRNVFLTGHTGFVGGWLSLVLCQLGARVVGFALPPDGEPCLFSSADVGRDIISIEGDIREPEAVAASVQRAAPDVVFHLAAQPLVRAAYARPRETFEVNTLGTVHLLEILRRRGHSAATIVMTTDKVYHDVKSKAPYQEGDELGGHEPYSASKAAAELVANAYRESYPDVGGIATLRAGNILGGGDWGADRIIPDAVRAFACHEALVLRRPDAIRPWQHVYDVLTSALLLAQALWVNPREIGAAWNFGPPIEQQCTVEGLVRHFCDTWGGVTYRVEPQFGALETGILRLDSSKARSRLRWESRYDLSRTINETVAWYKAHGKGQDMAAYSRDSLAGFLAEH